VAVIPATARAHPLRLPRGPGVEEGGRGSGTDQARCARRTDAVRNGPRRHEVERATARHIDLDDPQQIALDDHFAFKLFQGARVLGLFPLESPGQQDLLSRLQPRNVGDVSGDISLFRPGPVASGMPEQYIAARHGATPPTRTA